MRELQRAMQESVPTEEETLQVGPGLQDIAQLIGLKATVELYRSACVVDVDEGENPHDVTWDYGELYDAFVQEVDWSLLFDGDYYIETFPGLAHLYHKDKDLLLRHFQTVGIHEGRQGCQDFNVAAYQKNCGAEVREAFGDNYECYYFYYAMNQKTQKEIVSTGSEKKQLTTKLTHMQQTELDNLNEYRAEVGAAPLEYDAELSALACYRAYIDALEDWDAHDWIEADENQDEIQDIQTLAIDSIYTPIKNVKYAVENFRVDQKTDYEKLIIEITTNGSILPKEALKEAAKILIYHLMLFSDEKITIEATETDGTEEFDEEILHMRQLLKTKLVDMDLSVRALNCLKSAEVETLGELVVFNKTDLLKFRNFGKKSLTELDELLANLGLSFGMDISKYKLDKE